jgi:anti-anti-sigma factor
MLDGQVSSHDRCRAAPAALLTVRMWRTPHAAVVHVCGELDMNTGPHVTPVLGEALDAGLPTVVVDLTHLRFLGAIGITLLAQTRLQAAGRGIELHVAGARPLVVRLFRLTGMDALFRWHPCLTTALAAVEEQH